MPAIKIKIKDAAAVSIKKASLAEDHILVAKVEKPRGLKIYVNGNSFKQRIKTKIPPYITPGVDNFTIIL